MPEAGGALASLAKPHPGREVSSFLGPSRSIVPPHHQPERSPGTASSLERLWDTAEVRELRAGEHLFRAGSLATCVYKVESGAFRLYRFAPPRGDRRHIVDFLLPRDIIGLEICDRCPLSAQAIMTSRTRRVPKSVLTRSRSKAGNDSGLLLDLVETLSVQLSSTRELLLVVSRRNCEESLAAFLANLSRRNELQGADPRIISLPMSRGDLADYLGVTVETVSRIFKRLKQRHLITSVGRHRVVVRDLDSLRTFITAGAADTAGQVD